jgi:hypothetical protein
VTNPEAEHAQPRTAADSTAGIPADSESQGVEGQAPQPQGEPASHGGADPSGGSGQQGRAEGADREAWDAAEEQATQRLEKAVRAAEQALIEFEIAVETFRVEVENFSRLHHQRLGPMYSRLDELDALIAEAVAARSGDAEDMQRARQARALVQPMPQVEELFGGWIDSDGLSPEASSMLTGRSVRPPKRVRPSDEVRRIFRELVRKAHPDLAGDEPDRKRREEFIVRVNAAYGDGDEALLRQLADEWAAGPAPEARRPSRSEELYARLEWLAQRKELLAAVAAELEDGAIGAMIKLAPDDPDQLLDEIAERLLAQVAEREAYLATLVG